jgi:hypothetical protein
MPLPFLHCGVDILAALGLKYIAEFRLESLKSLRQRLHGGASEA